MITFEAAVRNVVKLRDINKLYCVKSLLDIMEVFADKIRYTTFTNHANLPKARDI